YGPTPKFKIAPKKTGKTGAYPTTRASSLTAPPFSWPAIDTPTKKTKSRKGCPPISLSGLKIKIE
ncbi:hypothetical protein, partial [Salmonella enterica]|uniref:hypothetical protein n=1 Tax=Salmonella enterica TaxID=28901 RepID=UPI0020C51793